MAEEVTQRATGEGAPAPSQPAVAEAGNQTPSEAPDLDASTIDWSKVKNLDLARIPHYREVDANYQRKLAEADRRLRDAEGYAQEMSRRTTLDATRSKLTAQGLDERAINETLSPVEQAYHQERAINRQRAVMDEYGFRPGDLSPEDYGQSEGEMRARLGAKKALKEAEEVRKVAEATVKEAELKKQESERVARDAERQVRKVTGADRLASGEPEPPPGLQQEWEAAVKEARRTGVDIASVNRRFRAKGLPI